MTWKSTGWLPVDALHYMCHGRHDIIHACILSYMHSDRIIESEDSS